MSVDEDQLEERGVERPVGLVEVSKAVAREEDAEAAHDLDVVGEVRPVAKITDKTVGSCDIWRVEYLYPI